MKVVCDNSPKPMKYFQNLWGSHPPFQIDCNLGYAAGANEMLVQSHMGFIHLPPALPQVVRK